MQEKITYIKEQCQIAHPEKEHKQFALTGRGDIVEMPYTLCDVLLAIRNILPRDGTMVFVNAGGGFVIGNVMNICSMKPNHQYGLWNLKNDDLRFQHPLTIEFLYQTLKANQPKI